MSITDLITKIEAEIMTYNHVRDTETGLVADLIVGIKNMFEDKVINDEEETPVPIADDGVGC